MAPLRNCCHEFAFGPEANRAWGYGVGGEEVTALQLLHLSLPLYSAGRDGAARVPLVPWQSETQRCKAGDQRTRGDVCDDE